MNRRNRILGAAAVCGLAALTFVGPASGAWAADATGCSGSVVSTDGSGALLGTASAPGEGGTQADPLPVDMAGRLAWKGSTDAVITNATWSVTVMGVPLLSGTFDNADGQSSAEGIENLADLPSPASWAVTGDMVIPVTGSITGDGGSCTASGYITGTGSATSSPMFYGGIAFALLGLVLAASVIAGTKATAAAAAATAAGGKV